MKDYRNTVRRFKSLDGHLYDVADQTGLGTATPSDPMDAMVILEYHGRILPRSLPAVMSVTVRYMLENSEEYHEPKIAGAHGEGEPITKDDDR